LRILLALALLAYPLAVYFLIDRLSPLALAGLFAVVSGARLLLATQISQRAIGLGLLAIFVLCVATFVLQDTSAIKLYPVVLSTCGALWCGYTLITRPSAIERLLNAINKSSAGLPARLRDRIPFDTQRLVPSMAQRTYMNRLTMVWLVFFVGNALAAATTAVAASTATWSLYNGLISYALAGTILLVEFVYRPFYQRKHDGEPL